MGVAIGRFVAGICSKWMKIYTIIVIGIGVIITGCFLLFVSTGTVVIVLGLMMIGIGNGPMFPNFNYLTPILYGEEKSPALIGSEYTSASISTMTVPIIVGQIAGKLGFGIFPYVIAISTLLLIVAYTCLYKKMITLNKEYK